MGEIVTHFPRGEENRLFLEDACIAPVKILFAQFAFFIHKSHDNASAGFQHLESFPEGFQNMFNKPIVVTISTKSNSESRTAISSGDIPENPDSLFFSFYRHFFRPVPRQSLYPGGRGICPIQPPLPGPWLQEKESIGGSPLFLRDRHRGSFKPRIISITLFFK